MAEHIVCKFGGTSLADAGMVRQVIDIVRSDPRRKYIVLSAPGKRHKDDQKITDLLFLCYELASNHVSFEAPLQVIANRFSELAAELGVPGAADAPLAELRAGLEQRAALDWVVSRGEHINTRLIAEAMGVPFVDTADCLGIDNRGVPLPETYDKLAAALAEHEVAAVPGYYGYGPDGQVKVFSRGGSDISGAVVARAVGAAVYENWTDVSGFMMADPRIVADPLPMGIVTYAELRELSYMGASVLHEEAIFPVREAGIPIRIKNTCRPEDPGTLIVASREPGERPVVGIAGKTDFTVIYIYKNLMNRELGFGRRVLGILESHGISYEHTPTGIDSMSLVIANEALGDDGEAVREEILTNLKADECTISRDLALISTVGIGMAYHVGIAARCFQALGRAGVNVRMISQGVGELSIIIGVAVKDFEAAVRALYDAFVQPMG